MNYIKAMELIDFLEKKVREIGLPPMYKWNIPNTWEEYKKWGNFLKVKGGKRMTLYRSNRYWKRKLIDVWHCDECGILQYGLGATCMVNRKTGKRLCWDCYDNRNKKETAGCK